MDVTIKAPAHLHVGNFDLSGSLGRLYGTIGFTVDIPLELKAKKKVGIKANDRDAYKFAEYLCKQLKLDGVEIRVRSTIPKDVGLGFRTTLALSVGRALSDLYRLDLTTEEIASLTGRGLITALGIYAFKHGGFLIDGGCKIGDKRKDIPPLIFRSSIPENWRFIIAVPNKALNHVAEIRKQETSILSRLKRMSDNFSAELCRLIVVKLLPSFIEGDYESFWDSLTKINSKLGEFWNEYQGGIYCHPIVEKGIKLILRKAKCACQSSWGPAFYSIVDNETKATELAEELRGFLIENGGGTVFCAKPNNKGALITT